MDLRKLPQVDRVTGSEELSGVRAALGRRALTSLAREVIAGFRERMREGASAPGVDEVVREVLLRAERRRHAGVARVVNATGVLLHTNLGRAPLPAASLARIAETAGGYSTLELDVDLGVRTRRGAAAEAALAELVGAEDALLVNNNAAAVLLVLSSLAAGREVIVSRGELVEIGGGFRIPEVLARSGARLVEVGTTNRTRVEDYARAVNEHSACLLRVHPSNFKMTGFAERPELAALADLAHSRGLPLVKDLGGGLVIDPPMEVPSSAELAAEPTVMRCLAAGVDLVCFSLDKLFGGPQGGAVVGSRELVGKLRDDPLARALRVGKLTLAALEPILNAYARDDLASIPLHAMLHATSEELAERVEGWRRELGPLAARTRVETVSAAVGGGTLAEAPIGSVALVVTCENAERVARELRRHEPPVVARISEGEVILDARSVLPGEDPIVARALCAALTTAQKR